jgi:hypothetical protein
VEAMQMKKLIATTLALVVAIIAVPALVHAQGFIPVGGAAPLGSTPAPGYGYGPYGYGLYVGPYEYPDPYDYPFLFYGPYYGPYFLAVP